MQKRRVVVTGAGVVTPAGLSLEENWEKMVNGRVVIQKIERFDVSGFPTRIGGFVHECDPNISIKNRRNMRFLRSDVRYCMASLKSACEDAGLDFSELDPTHLGLYVGSGESETRYDSFFPALRHSLNEDESIDYKKFGAVGLRVIYPSFLLLDLANNGLCYSSIEHGIMGVNNNYSCGASGGHAIGEAFKAVQRGETDSAVAGGHDSLVSCFENYFLYTATGLVTREEDPLKAMKPYSAGRDGFVLSEGAGFIVLEELHRAVERDACIRGEIVGYSCNCDTNSDLLEPDPQGEGLFHAMKAALDDAGVAPSRIDYINSEGNATPINDVAETRAFKRLLNRNCFDVPISTVKPVIGYAGAASSAIELIATLLALEKQTIPPTVSFTGGDPECDLDYVPNDFRTKEMEYALSINKGWGGQNCVFLLRRFER